VHLTLSGELLLVRFLSLFNPTSRLAFSCGNAMCLFRVAIVNKSPRSVTDNKCRGRDIYCPSAAVAYLRATSAFHPFFYLERTPDTVSCTRILASRLLVRQADGA
jgi:hypothetical protein